MVLQVNYLGDYSLEIFEDPSAMALVEVKVLSSLDLIDRLIQERIKMSYWSSTKYWWQRIIRGRYYKHLMLGYRT
ncbi:hypothetical protein F2Q69_00011659 [Brassica cretica]|uniref:Uncharacterized protein n=1 Tax=Brassica cretica TaxID=69181 RepID=A0A8S9R3A0_BRACR|nr:hypothetical protein F2Q69_00011659 [Brassica cretica]